MRCRLTHDSAVAAEALREGRLVALPTETVYGLGGNALDVQAVAQIFAAKERPAFDPLIVHIASVDRLPEVAAEFPPLARKLAAQFWPGPLTLVLPKTQAVPELVTSGLSTVAVRVPDHPQMQDVLRLTGFPIAAPSANLFGRLSPTTPEHVLEQLGDRIDLVLDGGPCRVGVESTIIQIDGNQSRLLRPGGISMEVIEQLIGPLIRCGGDAGDAPSAPGQLLSHYAPRTPLQIVDTIPHLAPARGTGALLFAPQDISGYDHVEVLSATGDLVEAATRFFRALHDLDNDGRLQIILAEKMPDHGLGWSLNDRLSRAATR
jgi:L-threonylcarbamoyladenylate synthase